MVPRPHTIVGTATIIGTAVAAVVAAVVAASLTTGPILGPQRIDASTATPLPQDSRKPVAQAADDGALPTWFVVSMSILLGLYALTLLALVLLRKGDDEDEDAGLEAAADEDSSIGAWQVVLPVDLGNAAASQLARLHLGTPRNAIVACWMGLRAATVGAGMPEVPSETSEEFMVRAVEGLGLDPPAIRVLAALYREARFSEHAMTESQRDRAGEALRVLADQLTTRRTEQSSDLVLEGLAR